MIVLMVLMVMLMMLMMTMMMMMIVMCCPLQAIASNGPHYRCFFVGVSGESDKGKGHSGKVIMDRDADDDFDDDDDLVGDDLN